jgi:hypothetical protein
MRSASTRVISPHIKNASREQTIDITRYQKCTPGADDCAPEAYECAREAHECAPEAQKCVREAHE